MIKRLLLMLILSTMPFTTAWSADSSPGGNGKFARLPYDPCFKTSSDLVTKVCVDYTITWSLSTLMGEPMGDYHVSWKMASLELRNPSTKEALLYEPYQLPDELKKPANSIELYIDAFSGVKPTSGNAAAPTAYLRFNTGVGVRSGGKKSLNVTDGYNWDKLFFSKGFILADCNKNMGFLNADEAKQLFRRGVNLSAPVLCKESGVFELGALESAIDKLCSNKDAHRQYGFCPFKVAEKPDKGTAANKNSDPFLLLDRYKTSVENKRRDADPFDALNSGTSVGVATKPKDTVENLDNIRTEKERLRIAEQEQKDRHDKANQFCIAAFKEKDDCIKRSSCGSEPDKTVCTQYEARKSSCPVGYSCLTRYDCVLQGPSAYYAKWESCSKDALDQCSVKTSSPNVEACIKERLSGR